MSSCPIHGPLLGGYVLGALEPREMQEMEQHVSKCPHCGPEARRLAALPTLLDKIQPADVPPPTLSQSVEEALLDRFAREHRRTRRPRLTPRRILALAGACVAALAVALALVWPTSDDDDQAAYARAKLGPPAGSTAGARAVAYASDVPAGTRVSLRARGLRGGMYELWCVRPDGRWVSGGSFRSGRDGRAAAQLTAAVRRGDYHVMVVTRSASEEEAHGKEVLRGQLVY